MLGFVSFNSLFGSAVFTPALQCDCCPYSKDVNREPPVGSRQ